MFNIMLKKIIYKLRFNKKKQCSTCNIIYNRTHLHNCMICNKKRNCTYCFIYKNKKMCEECKIINKYVQIYNKNIFNEKKKIKQLKKQLKDKKIKKEEKENILKEIEITTNFINYYEYELDIQINREIQQYKDNKK